MRIKLKLTEIYIFVDRFAKFIGKLESKGARGSGIIKTPFGTRTNYQNISKLYIYFIYYFFLARGHHERVSTIRFTKK